MTSDILMRIEVDVVIFTVVENRTLEMLDGLGLVSPELQRIPDSNGLSLFVVTMQDEQHAGRVLPGDAIRSDESIDRAARRITAEKLGLSLRTKLHSLKAFDNPRRGGEARIISFPYWGMVNFEDLRKFLGGRDQVGLELVNSPDFMQNWNKSFGLSNFDGVSRFGNRRMPQAKKGITHTKAMTTELPGGRILAHDHDDMVFYAWRALRHAFDGKLDPFNYLSINPLGDEFRISDLQAFQEVCRGETLQRDTFRRMMMLEDSYLKATGSTDNQRAGKPANLYSLALPPVAEDN